TLTVDEIIADEAKMIVFYTLETDKDYNYIMFSDLEFTDEAGEDISMAYGYGNHSEEIEKGKAVSGKIDIEFGHLEKLPKQINMSANIDVGNSTFLGENKTWDINFTIDHEKFANHKEVFPINETVIVEGQKITFKEIIVYPTRIAVQAKYDEQNSMELFAFDDLAIVNENGDEWASINNSFTAQEYIENEEILFLQSNFFEQPKELYLHFS